MTSKTNPNLATAVTETFITQAEQIIRSHDDFCIGYYETTEPWCSAAPVGTPLCRGCRALADKIAKALRTQHQERDWTVGKLELRINQLKARAEAAEGENRTLKAQLEQVKAIVRSRVDYMRAENRRELESVIHSRWTGRDVERDLTELYDQMAALTASPHRKDT